MLDERRAILLVDDDPDDRFLVERCWQEAGLKNPLTTLDGGGKALDYLFGRGEYADRTRHPLPALLLIDLKMPEVSGFDVLRRLRADEALRGLPVIVLTASTSPGDVAEAHRLGANAFYVKPSTVKELVALFSALKGCWLRFGEFPVPEEGKMG